jgi:hypothetical protein
MKWKYFCSDYIVPAGCRDLRPTRVGGSASVISHKEERTLTNATNDVKRRELDTFKARVIPHLRPRAREIGA